MTYNAIVAKIEKIEEISGANTIALATVLGNNVIVGKDSKIGDIGVYFPVDGQLSEEFCEANDLIERKNEHGEKVGGGYFSNKRRIVAKRFMKVKSEGFFVPFSMFDFALQGTYDFLKEGVAFNELNGIPICQKYYSPETLKVMSNNSKFGVKKVKSIQIDFPKHRDTEQFRFAKDRINPQSRIVITEKCHGTSVRYGLCSIKYTLPFWKKMLNKLYPFFKTEEMDYVLGTRNAILERKNGSYFEFHGGFYSGGKPYDLVAKLLYGKLKENEAVYGEIVGFVTPTMPLFEHDISGHKELTKKYQKKNMVYSYGCVPGEQDHKFFVYRITQNGKDLSWNDLKARCSELGISHVPETPWVTLENMADHLEMTSVLDKGHISEGFCIREEFTNGEIKIYKEKAFNFRVLEGFVKENDTYIDPEEINDK